MNFSTCSGMFHHSLGRGEWVWAIGRKLPPTRTFRSLPFPLIKRALWALASRKSDASWQRCGCTVPGTPSPLEALEGWWVGKYGHLYVVLWVLWKIPKHSWQFLLVSHTCGGESIHSSRICWTTGAMHVNGMKSFSKNLYCSACEEGFPRVWSLVVKWDENNKSSLCVRWGLLY